MLHPLLNRMLHPTRHLMQAGQGPKALSSEPHLEHLPVLQAEPLQAVGYDDAQVPPLVEGCADAAGVAPAGRQRQAGVVQAPVAGGEDLLGAVAAASLSGSDKGCVRTCWAC